MHCWARYVFLITVAALGMLAIAGACGRKGALYLPESQPTKEAPASATPAPGSDVPSAPSTDAPVAGPSRP